MSVASVTGSINKYAGGVPASEGVTVCVIVGVGVSELVGVTVVVGAACVGGASAAAAAHRPGCSTAHPPPASLMLASV